LLFPYGSHRTVSQGIIGILIQNPENPGWTNLYTFPATVAFIRINRDEKFTGSIFVSIVCKHGFSSWTEQTAVSLLFSAFSF
jgi:hypothetical protein